MPLCRVAIVLALCALPQWLAAQEAQTTRPVTGKTNPDLFAASKAARAGGRYAMLLRQFRADEPARAEQPRRR